MHHVMSVIKSGNNILALASVPILLLRSGLLVQRPLDLGGAELCMAVQTGGGFVVVGRQDAGLHPLLLPFGCEPGRKEGMDGDNRVDPDFRERVRGESLVGAAAAGGKVDDGRC